MITTFGEIMLRISPKEPAEKIITSTDFEIRPGGSESNVAIALANLGERSGFLSLLPDNPLGEKIIRYLRQENVDTSHVKQTGDRLGVYWTETGLGPRNSFVIYDRNDSAFTRVKTEDFEWEKVFDKTKWFHFSGISPAVGEKVFEVLQEIVEICPCHYSVDLNYRDKLWAWLNKDREKIGAVMTKLCKNARMIAGNESDFQNVFGFMSRMNDPEKAYSEIAYQCFDKFESLDYVAISNRTSHSATTNEWNGYLFVRNEQHLAYKGMTYILDNIADRVGTGDSFVAGIIYGLIRQKTMKWQEIIDFAVTLGALNHSTKGDASHFSKKDVMTAIKTKGSGRILR